MYLKLGHLFRGTGALLMALDYAEKALYREKIEGDLRAQAACYELLSSLFEGLGRLDDAILSQEGILAYAEAAGDMVRKQRSLATLGQLRNKRIPGTGDEAMQQAKQCRVLQDGHGFTGPGSFGRSFVYKGGKDWT